MVHLLDRDQKIPLVPDGFLRAESAVLSGMPRIPDVMVRSIGFLYPTHEAAKNNMKQGGTCFVVGRIAEKHSQGGDSHVVSYLVSNRHVVWNAGCSVARFNRADDTPAIIDLEPTDWVVHPGHDDVAVAFVRGLAARVMPGQFANSQQFILPANIEEYTLGIGEEVFMVGRFINHQGGASIRPAVRFGCISMMPEPVWNKATQRLQESYAVEMRSRTGFSGSPVVAYRTVATNLATKFTKVNNFAGLLGVNWGYILDEDGENTWLNGVVPAWKIMEVLDTPALRKIHDEIDSAGSYDAGVELAVASAGPEPSTKADNPRHKEDFSRLLDAAARTPKQGDQT